MSAYEQCVIDASGHCVRWSHQHEIECHACGHEFPADDAGCASCTICPSCTPAACICAEGRQLRREDAAEADWRRFKEATGVGAVGW